MSKIKKNLCYAITVMICVSNAEGVRCSHRHLQDSRRSMALSGKGSGGYFQTHTRVERNRYAVSPQERRQTIQWRDGNFSPTSKLLPADPSPKEGDIQRIFTKDTAAAFMAYDDFYFWNPLRNVDPLLDIQGPDYLKDLKTLYYQTLEVKEALQEVEDGVVDDGVITQIVRAQNETDEQFSKLRESISILKRHMPAEQLQDEVRKSLNLFMYPELLISDLQRIDFEEWKDKFSRVYERLIIAKRRFEQLKEIEHWEQRIAQHQTAIRATLERSTQKDSKKSEKERQARRSTVDQFIINWSDVISSKMEQSIISYISKLQEEQKLEQLPIYVIRLRIQQLQQKLRWLLNLKVIERMSGPLKNVIDALCTLVDTFKKANSAFRMN